MLAIESQMMNVQVSRVNILCTCINAVDSESCETTSYKCIGMHKTRQFQQLCTYIWSIIDLYVYIINAYMRFHSKNEYPAILLQDATELTELDLACTIFCEPLRLS